MIKVKVLPSISMINGRHATVPVANCWSHDLLICGI